MASVGNWMNSDLVYLRDGDRAISALRPILDFGITAVPVLDEEHRPVGVVALRDLVDCEHSPPQASEPVVTVGITDSVESAARAMATSNVHHLVVVDSGGRAVGMLSSLDVIRGLLGLPAQHPKAIASFGAAHRRTG